MGLTALNLLPLDSHTYTPTPPIARLTIPPKLLFTADEVIE